MSFSAFSILSFCHNHHVLQLFGRPQWFTVRSRSRTYVKKVKEELENRGCQIRTGCAVRRVSKRDGCLVMCEDGYEERYSGCIIATHAPDTLRMLGEQATYDERRILGSFNYVYSDIFLHRDKSLMPKNSSAWSAWNFLGTVDSRACLTYWLNVLQLLKWTTGHPIPSVAATKASLELHCIQGKRGIWFCGAYQGYGFHEDGLKAGIVAANGMLSKSCEILNYPKHMVPSLIENGAMIYFARFLQDYVVAGTLIILEEGGTMFRFEGTSKKSCLKAYVKVHNPQFYWQVFADAYINGDFSVIDKKRGLLDMFMIFAVNSSLQSSASWFGKRLVEANVFNSYNIICKNNKLFSLLLDETMTYSCAIFKSEDENLKAAQMRKISSLIKKLIYAKVDKNHAVLEIGCGWGSLAIELVKQTGCKYTGITLSEEQISYAEAKVKEAGLQEQIKFLLCDYRQLPDTCKYDRIISCEMLEAVGHEYTETFFGCCESVLAEDGLFVLQFIAVPENKYNEYRNSPGFLKEYIFPGGCVPSLGRVTSTMAASSNFCVEHVENIGIHYYQTLRCWRSNFFENQSEILALGFNGKFIRTWEYYFDYCAAGFKTCILENYQVVLSRPGNVAVLGDPYKDGTSICS